jgi:hypothetical protein
MFRSRRRVVPVSLWLFGVLVITGVQDIAANGRLESVEMPRTLKTEAALIPQLTQMLATSATFRAQCARLHDADKLVVLLQLNPVLPRGLFRARSTLRRYSSGLLIATVEVAPGSGQPEWIGHEFEHVLEMMEGLNLPGMAKRSSPGVWRSVDGMLETARATEIGRTILFETRLVDVSDKFVE